MTQTSRSTTVNGAAQDDLLIKRFVARHPHKWGVAEVWLPDYGYSVWILICALRAAGATADSVARDYEIPVDAMRAAVAYYHRHRTSIDAQIQSNDDFFITAF